ncbi:amidohydrolase family protein [Fodinibius sediminis]|uniref:L-fuconolactonase n=1 Tax=Fodinibius sediminis TaxID=1214077 RepID=A0A521EMZ7_9BACT|nr:amidohydrolase family protein [Fodinibius sediminis]SMO85315.1 L-fuconolactonase [Fodinibius sediminis]
MNRIDSHQHFWEYDPVRDDWITDEMAILQQNFMPEDLQTELNRVGMQGCIAVQADQSEAETRFLLSLAEQHDIVRGVVGWLDIRSAEFRERLDHYASNSTLKGLRHLVQDEENNDFLLQPDFLKGIEILGSYDMTYDILIFAHQLPAAVSFAGRFPDQTFVLDHLAKPLIKAQRIDDWEAGIRDLAQHPQMYCKLSGMVTEADWGNWSAADFKPYLDVVFDAFGTDRLMFGSDWPVCLLAAEYEEVFDLVQEYIEPLSRTEKEQILGGNAMRCYGLN